MAAIEAITDRNQAPITLRHDDEDQVYIGAAGVEHGKNPTDGPAARTSPQSLRQATELDGARNKVAGLQQKADAFAANNQTDSADKSDRIGTPGRAHAAPGQQGYFLSPLQRLRQMREPGPDGESPKTPGWA